MSALKWVFVLCAIFISINLSRLALADWIFDPSTTTSPTASPTAAPGTYCGYNCSRFEQYNSSGQIVTVAKPDANTCTGTSPKLNVTPNWNGPGVCTYSCGAPCPSPATLSADHCTCVSPSPGPTTPTPAPTPPPSNPLPGCVCSLSKPAPAGYKCKY